jgi:hypothetical protein
MIVKVTGQDDQKCLDMTESQDCQYTVASIVLPGQDSSAGLSRQSITSGTEQSEQVCYDTPLILYFILALSLNLKGP